MRRNFYLAPILRPAPSHLPLPANRPQPRQSYIIPGARIPPLLRPLDVAALDRNMYDGGARTSDSSSPDQYALWMDAFLLETIDADAFMLQPDGCQLFQNELRAMSISKVSLGARMHCARPGYVHCSSTKLSPTVPGPEWTASAGESGVVISSTHWKARSNPARSAASCSSAATCR